MGSVSLYLIVASLSPQSYVAVEHTVLHRATLTNVLLVMKS